MPDFASVRISNGKTDAEFFAVATEVINSLESELLRALPEERGRWRALEIGCGSGRLMRPLSRHFLEIHGVDTSGKLVLEARENLRDLANAHLYLSPGAALTDFPEESVDFIYSYDFFPQIPNREQVLEFLRESQRVLQVGGLARLEFTGVSGAPFSSQELLEFADAHDLQVLALDGVSTQSMWITWRKHAPGWSQSLAALSSVSDERPVMIRRITNASSFEPVAPCRGRFASISLRVENLSPHAGLNHLRVTIGNSLGTITYIGPPDRTGGQQIRVDLPELEATGLLPVQMFWLDQPISEPATLRVIPPGPPIPRVVYAPKWVANRVVKMTLEEIARPYEIEIAVEGRPVDDIEKICTDPRPQRYEIKFRLPEGIAIGTHHIGISIGRRKLPLVPIEVDA